MTTEEKILEIAKKHFYEIEERGDLETRNNDSADFIDAAVWSIKSALQEAYEAGRKSAQ